MPAGNRVRANNVFGTVDDNPLLIGAGAFNSSELALLPTIAAAHAIVTLDPLRQFGEPEIVVVTVHTASATVATITRGQYGTLARQHPQNTVWTHAALDEDFTEILTSGTRPVDPYRGATIFETDTNRFVARSTTDVWQQRGLFFDPPACRVTHNTAQSLVDNTDTTLVFNTEVFDTDTMHNTVTNNSRITVNTAGLYVIGGAVRIDAASDFLVTQLKLQKNGATIISWTIFPANPTNSVPLISISTVYKFAATDYIELLALQNNTANTTENVSVALEYSPIFYATWVGRGN